MSGQPKPPSVKGHFLLGNMREVNTDTLPFMLAVRNYGDIVVARFGPFPFYILNHPDSIHQVLVTDADKYHKSRGTKRVMYPLVGNGLFTNDGESWKRQRRLAQPAFHTKRIGAYAEVMVKYADEMMRRWEAGHTYNMDQ
jgi:cytochrome P450